jgi:ribosomal protein S28E/S33
MISEASLARSTSACALALRILRRPSHAGAAGEVESVKCVILRGKNPLHGHGGS